VVPLSLAEVADKLERAGGFGDGVDFGPFRPFDVLADPGISDEVREVASLVLLCELAEAVDNSTWKDAVKSSHGRRLRRLLDGDVVVTTQEVAMRAFFSGEAEFFAALQSVYSLVVDGKGMRGR